MLDAFAANLFDMLEADVSETNTVRVPVAAPAKAAVAPKEAPKAAAPQKREGGTLSVVIRTGSLHCVRGDGIV